jgi:IS1 family transposase/transposase-like protein
MICKSCSSENIKKAGRFKNRNGIVQRYCCRDCGKTFSHSNNNGMRVHKRKIYLAIELLRESNSVRATSRITGLHQETVLKILRIAGVKSAQFTRSKIKNLKSTDVQADEIYSIVYSRRMNTPDEDRHRGAQFTFLAVDRKHKLIIHSHTGARTTRNATKFLTGLRRRVPGKFQLTTDKWIAYCGRNSVLKNVFGDSIDHASETKIFKKPSEFAPKQLVRMDRCRHIGNPDMNMATTAHIERTNLSLRHFNRRFTRCTPAFSKTLKNHRYSVYLFQWSFNFCRKHTTLGTTPAIAMGVISDKMTVEKLWNYKGSATN